MHEFINSLTSLKNFVDRSPSMQAPLVRNRLDSLVIPRAKLQTTQSLHELLTNHWTKADVNPSSIQIHVSQLIIDTRIRGL